MKSYTYVVSRVDTAYGVVEVEYTAEGFDPVIVGMPLPLADQQLDDLVKQYAPQTVWENVERSRKPAWVPVVGTRGSVNPQREPSAYLPPAGLPTIDLEPLS